MRFALNKKVFKTISFRIAALFCITFTVGITLAFLITYFEISYSLEKSSKEVISSELHEAAVILGRNGVPGLTAFYSIEENRLANAHLMVRVLNLSGDTLYLKTSTQEKKFDFEGAFKQKTEPVVGWQSLPAIGDEDRFEILTEKVGADSYLQIGKSSEDREAILGNILEIFGSTGALLIILGGGLGLWYATRILKPIRNLVGTIQEIEKGNFSHRVIVGEATDELYDLGSTFNRMIARIESLIRIMRESLDHVAHDIRTPLTRIKAVAEDAMTSDQPTSLREALEDCAESASDISGIVDQLMSISEAEAGTMILKRESCNIHLLLTDVAEIYEFVALEKSIDLQIDIEPVSLDWKLDRKRIKQVVGNLLDNALKFSDDKSKIIVRARVENGFLKISVIDEGCGISSGDLPQIWDRLFRGDRSRTTKGSGLGLSIVRAVVTAHGGNVFALPNLRRGTTFAIEFPNPLDCIHVI
jgi:signal transduction histidine kinase